MKGKSESEVTESCPTLSDPKDCSLPGSSVHGIFQARVLEWGAIAFSQMTIISATMGKNPLEEMQQPSWSTKESEMQYLDAISKTTERSVHFQGKPFNITVIQVYAVTSNIEEAEVGGSMKTYKTFQN